MNSVVISILLSFAPFSWGIAQSNLEFSVTYTNSIFIRSKITGSSLNYDDFSQNSSYNLRAKSNNAMIFSLSNTIGKSNWIYFGGFEKRWLSYNTTIYSSTSSSAHPVPPEELVIKNQMNNFTFGMGRKFFFLKKKLVLNIQTGFVYRNYRDLVVETRKSPNSFYEIQTGDVSYNILLDHNINGKNNAVLKPLVSLSFGWQLLNNLRVDINLMKTDYFAFMYELSKKDYTAEEVETPTGVIKVVSYGGGKRNYLVKSRFESLGIGITYSIGKEK